MAMDIAFAAIIFNESVIQQYTVLDIYGTDKFTFLSAESGETARITMFPKRFATHKADGEEHDEPIVLEAEVLREDLGGRTNRRGSAAACHSPRLAGGAPDPAGWRR